MKTIIENSTGLSKYLLDDDAVVTMTDENITVGSPAEFIIADLNSGNATLTENVTDAPEDWAGNKYTYDGTAWTLNPDWIAPLIFNPE